MNTLPSKEEIAKLTLRSAVAYAIRGAYRVGTILCETPYVPAVRGALKLAENVACAPEISDVDEALIASAGVPILEAATQLAGQPRLELAVMSAMDALSAAGNALRAAANPARAEQCAARVTSAAIRAANPDGILDGEAAAGAVLAARKDFERLLRDYGENHAPTLGGPVSWAFDLCCHGPASLDKHTDGGHFPTEGAERRERK